MREREGGKKMRVFVCINGGGGGRKKKKQRDLRRLLYF